MQIRLFNANNAAFIGVTIAFGAVALAMYLGYFGEWRDAECDALAVQSAVSCPSRIAYLCANVGFFR